MHVILFYIYVNIVLKGVPNVAGVGRLLAAVMEALCHPAIKLTALMPINCEPETEAVLRRQSMCMDDNTNSVARLAEGHRYPVLASHMSYRMEVMLQTSIYFSVVGLSYFLKRRFML